MKSLSTKSLTIVEIARMPRKSEWSRGIAVSNRIWKGYFGTREIRWSPAPATISVERHIRRTLPQDAQKELTDSFSILPYQ